MNLKTVAAFLAPEAFEQRARDRERRALSKELSDILVARSRGQAREVVILERVAVLTGLDLRAYLTSAAQGRTVAGDDAPGLLPRPKISLSARFPDRTDLAAAGLSRALSMQREGRAKRDPVGPQSRLDAFREKNPAIMQAWLKGYKFLPEHLEGMKPGETRHVNVQGPDGRTYAGRIVAEGKS